MFNLFDEDGNGEINIEELLDMMAFFIEIGMDTGSVDMAATMAEVFQRGDKNHDDRLTRQEFIVVSIIELGTVWSPTLFPGHERTSGNC